jgi:hypothetical protein
MHVPNDFIKVTSGRGGVRNHKTDDLLGVNNEDSTDLVSTVNLKGDKERQQNLTVNGRPLASRLVASCSSSIS